MRDGLKPVHRRILFSMNEQGHTPDRSYVKSARVVGDVMGKYHPHGDLAIYDTLVRMAQPFSMGLLLIDGQGNFGSVDNDPPAQMRYTECRLTKAAEALLADIDSDTVDFKDNYDGKEREPVGPAGAHPQPAGQRLGRHRRRHGHQHPAAQPGRGGRRLPGDDRRSRRSALEALLDIVPGPDFPTGGEIIGRTGARAGADDRPRLGDHARHGRRSRSCAQGPRGDHHHRASPIR